MEKIKKFPFGLVSLFAVLLLVFFRFVAPLITYYLQKPFLGVTGTFLSVILVIIAFITGICAIIKNNGVQKTMGIISTIVAGIIIVVLLIILLGTIFLSSSNKDKSWCETEHVYVEIGGKGRVTVAARMDNVELIQWTLALCPEPTPYSSPNGTWNKILMQKESIEKNSLCFWYEGNVLNITYAVANHEYEVSCSYESNSKRKWNIK